MFTGSSPLKGTSRAGRAGFVCPHCRRWHPERRGYLVTAGLGDDAHLADADCIHTYRLQVLPGIDGKVPVIPKQTAHDDGQHPYGRRSGGKLWIDLALFPDDPYPEE